MHRDVTGKHRRVTVATNVEGGRRVEIIPQYCFRPPWESVSQGANGSKKKDKKRREERQTGDVPLGIRTRLYIKRRNRGTRGWVR